MRRDSRRRPRRRSLVSRILRNRYNPRSNWVSIGDIIENTKETWFAFTRRLPPGSKITRDRDGRIRSSNTRWNGPF
jgi:hypothetical protein